MLSATLLSELKGILTEDYSREFTDKEVFEIATTLMGYFELLIKSDSEQHEKQQ